MQHLRELYTISNSSFRPAFVSCNCLWLFFQQKQSKDRFGLEGDEESTMLEESVSPKKWVILTYHLLYCMVFILIQQTFFSY